MPIFSETAAAALRGRQVRATHLALLDFASQPMRLWLGRGTLRAGGYDWTGLGEWASVSGIESPLGGTAPVTTLALSGVDPDLVPKALNSSSEVKNRAVTIYIQVFDEDFQTLDSPYAVMSGTMDKMSIKADGPVTRTIELTAEWLFTRRAIPPFGYLSDRDQKSLFTGDRGLEQISTMQSKSVYWPVFK